MAKKLQEESIYAKYDVDGDGIVSDQELALAERLHELEMEDKKEAAELRKLMAQRRMATYTLVAMGLFTVAMFFVPVDRVKVLSDVSNLFYLSGAGIVGAYMGMSAWMSKK